MRLARDAGRGHAAEGPRPTRVAPTAAQRARPDWGPAPAPQAHAAEAGPAGRWPAHDGPPLPASALLAVLDAARLQGRANAPVRADALQTLQQTCGNRAVQRYLARQRPAAPQAGPAAPAAARPLPIQRRNPATPAPQGTDVGKYGRVAEVSPYLSLHATADPQGPALAQLNFNDRVFIRKEVPGDWYWVISEAGTAGYVYKKKVFVDPPEPRAFLHKIAAGQTPIGIAELYFKKYVEKDADLRFYTNVLVYMNGGRGKDEPGMSSSGDSWKDAKTFAGRYIWIPSVEYAKGLQGIVASGTRKENLEDLVSGAAEFLTDFAKGLKSGAVQALTDLYHAVKDLAEKIWSLLQKSLLDLAGELWDWLKSLTNEKITGALKGFLGKLGQMAQDFDAKWDNPNIYKQANFRGYVIGYVLLNVVVDVVAGAVAELPAAAAELFESAGAERVLATELADAGLGEELAQAGKGAKVHEPPKGPGAGEPRPGAGEHAPADPGHPGSGGRGGHEAPSGAVEFSEQEVQQGSRSHSAPFEDAAGAKHEYYLLEDGRLVRCSDRCTVILNSVQKRVAALKARLPADWKAGAQLDDVTAEAGRIQAKAAGLKTTKQVEQEVEQALQKLSNPTVKDKYAVKAKIQADAKAAEDAVYTEAFHLEESLDGLEREVRVRLAAHQEGYTQVLGETDDAIRAKLKISGKVADYVGENQAAHKWLLAEGKGTKFEHAMQQFENTLDGLDSYLRTQGRALTPGTMTDLRVYVSPENLAKLQQPGGLGGKLLDHDGFLGFQESESKFKYMEVKGIKVKVLVEP